MRGTVPSSKVGTGEVETRALAGAAAGLVLGTVPTAWAKAGPARMVATSSVKGASRIALVTGLSPSIGIVLVASAGRKAAEASQCLRFQARRSFCQSPARVDARPEQVPILAQIRREVWPADGGRNPICAPVSDGGSDLAVGAGAPTAPPERRAASAPRRCSRADAGAARRNRRASTAAAKRRAPQRRCPVPPA